MENKWIANILPFEDPGETYCTWPKMGTSSSVKTCKNFFLCISECVHGPCIEAHLVRSLWSGVSTVLLSGSRAKGSHWCTILPCLPHRNVTRGQHCFSL